MAGKHRKGADPVLAPDLDVEEGADTAADSAADEAVESLADSEAVDGPAAPAADERPSVPLAEAVLLPGRPSVRRAVRQERRQQARRVQLAVGGVALLVVLALVAWLVTSSHSTPPAAHRPAAPARTQQTLLLQVVDAQQQTLVSVLLGHDTAAGGTGFGALIPSTLLVNAPGAGSITLGQASGSGGPLVSAEAITDATGVLVDGDWQLSTGALASLVDAVGGVDVVVDEDIQQTTNGTSVLLMHAGQQHLGGALAATYATFLDPGAPEQQRLARLSTVLQELLAKLPPGAGPISALIAGSVSPSTSNVSAAHLAALLEQVRADADAGRLSFDTLPTHPLDSGGTLSTVVVDNTALGAFVKANFAGSLPKTVLGVALTVLVQNGVGTPGLDEKARIRLAAAGITYIDGANASSFDNPTSTVLIADGTAASRQQGAVVATALGLPLTDIKITAQGQNVAAVVVVIGDDFKP